MLPQQALWLSGNSAERTDVSLTFEKLNNTRDLAGLKTADGKKIKAGVLFRSGQLFKASENDIRLLEQAGIGKIIDLRTYEEVTEAPDPAVNGAQYLHLPVIKDLAAGITREKASDNDAVAAVVKECLKQDNYAVDYMCEMYRDFVHSEYTRKQYHAFVRELINGEGIPVLWHCTAGKDRTGFAAVAVLYLLGVSWDDITADYLATNENLCDEVNELTARYLPPDSPKQLEDAIRTLFGAREEFLDALSDAAQKKYGSFEGFLFEGIGITKEEQQMLKSIYLE